jgi:type II secretory pathway pseudopilin PulG
VFATSVVPIIIGVLILLILVLFLGGFVASGRRRQALRERLTAEIEAADAALAQARASDRGWDRAVMETAARAAFAAGHPDRTVQELQLVRVIDRPGTDADEAVFRVVDQGGHTATITLGRRDGAWVTR